MKKKLKKPRTNTEKPAGEFTNVYILAVLRKMESDFICEYQELSPNKYRKGHNKNSMFKDGNTEKKPDIHGNVYTKQSGTL